VNLLLLGAGWTAFALIGRIHGNLLIGLSYGWWISKHNRHHAHPNQAGRDPDIAGSVNSSPSASTGCQTRARHG
jgi:fatty acid desaturase